MKNLWMFQLVRDNDFYRENEFQSPHKGRSDSLSSNEDQDSSERIGFPQIIDEIFKLLPEDRFPSKADSSSVLRPKSNIAKTSLKKRNLYYISNNELLIFLRERKPGNSSSVKYFISSNGLFSRAN